MYFDFRLGRTLFKVRKLVFLSARSQSWLCPFNSSVVVHLAHFSKLGLILILALCVFHFNFRIPHCYIRLMQGSDDICFCNKLICLIILIEKDTSARGVF